MKKMLHSKVILYAVAIIVVCTGVLVTSIHVAFGAEQDKVVTEQSDGTVTTQAVQSESVAADQKEQSKAASAESEPGAQYITGEEAVEVFTKTISDVFGKTADPETLTATFSDDYAYANWGVENDTFSCYIDAISGDVITCDVITWGENPATYSGESITLGEFDSDPYYLDLRDDPENIYIQTATDIVNASLADGRSIDHVEIDGMQFYWDDNSRGFDPEATGTAAVDCHVYMETGLNYTLTLWGGTDALEVCVFYSHPTWDSCQWGYFYEEDASHSIPTERIEFEEAEGITEGEYTG